MRLRLIVLLYSAFAWGQSSDLYQARQLEASGKTHEAFRAYLSLPDAEYLAARIARSHATEYLALTEELLKSGDPELHTRLLLIRGDLLLVAGNQAGALATYREVSAAYAGRSDYPLEPPPESPSQSAVVLPGGGLARRSGSHRDNWLIRRFIALEAWPDADAEFARIWSVHRARPAVDAEFPLALEFTLDYAFYLKKRNQADRAIAVLEEQIFRLDLDRIKGYAPNVNRPGWNNSGITAGSFLNVAYGEFAEAHREKDLLRDLEADSRTTMKRIVAWVLLRQGRTDTALTKELEYIDATGWNEVSKSIRRGAIYEEFKRPQEAAAAYTRALAAQFEELNLPDSEWIAILGAPKTPSPQTSALAGLSEERKLRGNLQERLVRLYAALGNQESELMALSGLLQDEDRIANLDWLQHTSERFQLAGHAADFETLLHAQLPLLQATQAKAAAHWMLGDVEAVAQDLALDHTLDASAVDGWKSRFGAKGKPELRALLEQVVQARPSDVNSRLELLALADPAEADWAIREMEALVAPGMPSSYEGFKGPRNRTPFRSVFDIAYRLSRIYERSREFRKLMDLSLRVARGDSPFEHTRNDQAPHQVIALALEHASSSDLTQLAVALTVPQWAAERAQLERRTSRTPSKGRDFGWSQSLPAGVRLLASNEDVLALTSDDTLVYTGHPWGIAVYDHAGHAVTRVAIGHPVFALAAARNVIWAGTDKGLFRVALPAFEVSTVGLAHLDQPITELALQGDDLWIGGRNLARLHLPTRELNLFASEEAGLDQGWTFWQQFLFDGPYVWVHSGAGAHLFDTRTGSWSVPSDPTTGQQISLVGIVDGTLWACTAGVPRTSARIRVSGGFAVTTSLNETLQDSDLYQVDRTTLTLRRVQALTSEVTPTVGHNYSGRFEGKPVFGGWFYDPGAGFLRRVANQQAVISEIHAPEGLVPGLCWRRPDGVSSCKTQRYPLSYLRLSNGTEVVAERDSATEYLWDREWDVNSYLYARGAESEGGGVWFRAETGPFRHASMQNLAGTSASLFSDVLPSDRARQAVSGPAGEIWIGTEAGLVRTDGGFRVLQVIDRKSGLPSNRITSAAAVHGRLYFAADSEGDGGLVVYDPKTAIFNFYTDADGLPNRRVEHIQASSTGQLEISTGIVRRIRDSKDLRYPAVFFDPKRGFFSAAAEPVVLDQNNLPQPQRFGEMPWLGGPVVAEVSIHSERVLCGTRGMVVLKETAIAKSPGVFTVTETGTLLEKIAAEKVPYPSATPEALAPLLRDANPFVRLKALNVIVQVQSGDATWVGILASTSNDAFLPVRRWAARVIANAALPEWKDFLTRGLTDGDQQVRDSCAYGLAMLKEPAAMSYYESILRRGSNNSWALPPVYAALIKQPTPDVMTLLLRHPMVVDDFEGRRSLINQVGQALVQYPSSVDLVLHSRNPGEAHWSHATFAQAVLAAAGTAIRLQLLDALRSQDRVARSNAARALALMGDKAAIPVLLAALDMESGLSRASIVWALGKLHATEAVSTLASLYLVVAPRPESLQRTMYLAQMSWHTQWQYERFESVDALKASWDVLTEDKTSAPSAFSGEDTLTPEQILAALADIGPSSTSDFYRSLAASKDSTARYETAVRLADAGPRNADVLHGLLGDQDPQTAAAAAVSLLLLDDDLGRTQLLRWMEQCESLWFLHELNRVTDVKRLAFLKSGVASCEAKGRIGFSQQFDVARILERPRP